MRIVVFSPHFAEYSTRLAHALNASADVLLINETKNLQADCNGLQFDAADRPILKAQYAGRIATRRWSLRRGFVYRRICRAIEAFGPDIIHIQEQGDDFTASIAARFADACPIVLTVHDPVPHSGTDAIVAQGFAKGLARLRAKAAAYHVHGEYCATALRERLGPSKPMVSTRHGVILVPSPSQVGTGEDRFLFFGRMEAYKGLDTLLDAIDLLPKGTTRYALAGRGPELDRLRHRMAANPAIEVIDKFLPPAEAIHEFQRCRAVIVPYRDATQSGVISAAFGNGRPVIASAVGGLVDSVVEGNNGVLVPPDDPGALAAAMRRLSDPAVGAKLAGGARTAAATVFSWDVVARALLQLYGELQRARPEARVRPKG